MLPLFPLLLALSTAGAQSLGPEVAALNNLVENGGFEAGDAQPDWWARFPPEDPGNRQLRDSSEPHSGRASGLLVSTAPHETGKAGIQWNHYSLPVEGGSSVIVSYWVKTDAAGSDGCGCHFYGAARNHLGFTRILPPTVPSEWTHVRQTVRVPNGATTMGFAAYGVDLAKTWFDDIAVLGTPSAEVPRGTPTLDGRLDDACWSEDRAITQFVVHTGEKLPAPGTRAWMAYDDDSLYVAFDCPHPPGAALKTEAREHDGTTWLDDSIEVFLAPHHRSQLYYQLCVNNAGVTRDSYGTGTAWESGATAHVQHREGAWSVELAIPFANLGLDLDVGETWGLNLVRNDRVRGETSTWSLGGFHDPARFGSARLQPDLARYYRAGLARSLGGKETARDALRAELGADGLPPSVLRAAEPRIREATDAIGALRAIAEDRQPLPEGGWEAVRTMLAGIDGTLAAARSGAVSGLFSTASEAGGGFRVAIAHSLQKVRRDGEVLDGLIASEVSLEAARDETESFQLVVVPAGEPLSGVTVEAPALRGPDGEVPLLWNRVDYVETAEPGYPTEYVGWWPDPLLAPGPFDVKANERQPLWFNVSVPPEARPGSYEGAVTIRHAGQTVSVPVRLRVRSFRLPRPGTLSTAFGLYAPFFSRWWFGKQSYKDALPIDAYAKWCEFLGRYRLTPKNIAREYISVTDKDGQIDIDLSPLQTTVVPFATTLWAPYSFCLHRLPSSPALRDPNNEHTADEAARACAAFAQEWKRQGLPEQVYIYGYDEPRSAEYPFLQEAYRKVKAAAPGYPIMQTLGDQNPEALVGYVDIWCPLSAVVTSDFYAKRKAAGDTLWTYVCCGPKPPHANFFIDEPAVDHRVLFWQTWGAGATGLLYWGICIWDGPPSAASGEPHFPDAPIHMADHTTYKSFKVNGDGMLVYPGPDITPISSIRLEVIRDGIEDYEYLALLSRLVARAKALPAAERPPADLLARAEELLTVPEEMSRSMTDFTKDPNVIFARRKAVGDAIEELGRTVAPD